MKNENYTKDQLLDVIGSYLAMIIRDEDSFPTVVLSDIKASAKAVLKANEYNGRYAKLLDDNIREARYFTIWESGMWIGSSCLVNMNTKEVFCIQQVEVSGVEILEKELVVIDGTEHQVFEKSTVFSAGSFWRE